MRGYRVEREENWYSCARWGHIIYYCITNFLKFSNWKLQAFHSFYRSGIWKWHSWVVLSQGLSWGWCLDVRWGPGYLKDWWRLDDLLPRWLTHIPGKLVLVVGRRPQFLTTWTSQKCCLSVLTTWHLAFPRTRREQSGKCSIFHDLASEVTHHHFCNIL